jgi:type IV pilus assembly protein PilW
MTNWKRSKRPNNQGFSLIEVLVAIAVSGIVTGAIFMTYKAHQDSYANQEQVAVMQQNLRAAVYFVEREIRMAGYDQSGDAGAGIQVVDQDAIRFTMDTSGGESDGVDNDGDGVVDEDSDGVDNDGDTLVDEADEGDEFRYGDGAIDDPNEDITYSLFDIDGDGDMDLRREDPTVVPVDPAFPEEEFIAENFEALGFAFAFDSDGDGELDAYNVGGNRVVIWAVDTDNDSDLDANLDTDNDGDIDADDGPGAGGNGLIAGQALLDFDGIAIADVPLGDIRAVRVWMLGRSARKDTRLGNRNTYVIGSQVITPSTDADPNNDYRRMRLSVTTIKCRNLGL